MNATVYMSRTDAAALKSSLRQNMLLSGVQLGLLTQLKTKVDQAKVLPDEKMPPGVVALGAELQLEYCDDHETAICRLVLPHQAGPASGSVSILTPLAVALLGHTVGQTVEYSVFGNDVVQKVKILGVTTHVPEALALEHA